MVNKETPILCQIFCWAERQMGNVTLDEFSSLGPNVRLFNTYLRHLNISGLIFRNVVQPQMPLNSMGAASRQHL